MGFFFVFGCFYIKKKSILYLTRGPSVLKSVNIGVMYKKEKRIKNVKCVNLCEAFK